MTKNKAYAYTAQTLKIFWGHAKKYPWHLAAVVSGVLIYTSIQTYIPILERQLIDLLAAGTPGQNLRPMVWILVIILAASSVRMVIWRMANFANVHFESKVMRDLTNHCYNYLNRHSYGFFTSKFVGSLVTKVKRFERSFETLVDQFVFGMGRSLIDAVFVLGVIIWQFRELVYPILLWCVVFMTFTYLYTAKFKLKYDLRQAQGDTATTAQLADSLTNNANIKLFTNYDREGRRFWEVTEEQRRRRKKSWSLGVWGDAVQATMDIVAEFWIMYLAIRMWDQGIITVGSVFLIQVYMLRLFDKLWDSGNNMRKIYEALADANEMTEMLLSPHEVRDAPQARRLAVKEGAIDFKNVTFGYYKDLPVFKDFNLSIAPGERVALIGPSGVGKSTVLKLLFRFHDIQGGEILVDGRDIAKVTQDSLRAAIAFVPQDPILFHRSLLENIRYGRPKASEKEVIRAAKLAHAHEFISAFPQGYETLVGERGIKLSGGERQRVAIARAILKNAPILVLDEATSSLDSESEMFIQDALHTLMKGRTTIVVAHRLSTIMEMDRIVVIEHGAIKEEGTHQELLKARKGTYQKLWGIQAGRFAT